MWEWRVWAAERWLLWCVAEDCVSGTLGGGLEVMALNIHTEDVTF